MFIAKVKKAQLYLNSAELTKTFVATLPKGRYQYEILNFEQYEKPEISITGAKLLSHSAVEDKETVKEFEKKIEKLREEIKKLDIEIKKLRTDEALIQEEIKYYEKMAEISAESLKNFSSQEGEANIERNSKLINKIMELKKSALKPNDEIAKLDIEKSKLNGEIAELDRQRKNSKTKVAQKVDFVVENEGEVVINFKSSNKKAHWRPKSELNLNSADDLLSLTSSAEIIQNTGDNWEEVELSIAIVPPKSVEIPEFEEERLILIEENKERVAVGSQADFSQISIPADLELNVECYESMMSSRELEALHTEDYKSKVINVGGNFKVNLPSSYNIKNGEIPQISYFSQDFKAEVFSAIYQWDYEYEDTVILAVKFNLPIALLPQDLVLKKDDLIIDAIAIDDFLPAGSEQTLAFGEDNSFSVEKISVPDMNETKGFIGKEKIRNVEEKFIISANEDTKPLKIYARLPSSTDEAIIVEPKFDTKPDQEGVNGRKSFLLWNIPSLKKGEKKEFKFSYSIRYPQNKRIMYR